MGWKIGRFLRTRLVSLSTICLAFGFGLLIFNPGQNYRTIGLSNYQTNPTPTRPFDPTPTPPTQGGHGADVFYVYCMPCHGDQGQGLTDEFRNRQYPPEDVNCWKSGCHGEQPYANGFILPKTVPALIGPNALQKFPTAQEMYNFIHKAMPFNKPGSLDTQQYLYVMAFLLERNNKIPAGTTLQLDNLASIPVSKIAPAAATPAPDRSAESPAASDNSSLWIGLVAFIVIATVLSIITRPRKK